MSLTKFIEPEYAQAPEIPKQKKIKTDINKIFNNIIHNNINNNNNNSLEEMIEMESKRHSNNIINYINNNKKQKELKVDDFLNPGNSSAEDDNLSTTPSSAPSSTLTRNASVKQGADKHQNSDKKSRTFGYLLEVKEKPLEWISVQDSINNMFAMNEDIIIDNVDDIFTSDNPLISNRDIFSEIVVVNDRANLFFDDLSLVQQSSSVTT